MQNVEFLAQLFLKLQENGPLLSARPCTCDLAMSCENQKLQQLVGRGLKTVTILTYWLRAFRTAARIGRNPAF